MLIADFMHRYRSTYLKYNGELITPIDVVGENEFTYFYQTSPYATIRDSSTTFDYDLVEEYPKLGYIQLGYEAAFLSRVPGNQWRRGFTFQSIQVTRRTRYSMEDSFNNPLLRATFNPTFNPDISKAKPRGRSIKNALSYDFAIGKTETGGLCSLEYLRDVVGFITDDDTIILPQSYDYLEELIEQQLTGFKSVEVQN